MIFIKKLVEFSPLIVALVIIATIIGLFSAGVFDNPEETLITSSTLTEAIETAKLATAKYVQNGIAKVHIDGKGDGYVLYYAVVKPNINLEEITYDISEEKQEIIIIIPDKFTFDVEVLEDDNHKIYYYPKEDSGWTAKDTLYICETDAKQKAETNTELVQKAKESLTNTIEALLKPLLNESGYTISFKSSADLEV